jgi:crotonobetainyl-CoA:carnitine CoA-transferase CaiB-like acyl-CoA transferase
MTHVNDAGPRQAALANLRVVDLTHYVAGPYCTKLLAGFGAEVIKVEIPSSGDRLRSLGPFTDGQGGAVTSIPFQWLNTGKKGITLNLKHRQGSDLVRRLVRDADVLVENFSPRVMPQLGLDYDTLRQINPRLVMTSISNFGQSGPYRDYRAEEIQIEAMSGMMHVTGDPEKAPLAAGPAVCQYSGGLHAYIGTLLALFQREQDGQGRHVDVALFECGLENMEINLSNHLQLGREARRGPSAMVPWGLYECRDGHAVILAMPQRHWRHAGEIFDDPAIFEPRFAHVLDRMAHRQEYDGLLAPRVKARTREELFREGQERHLAFGYLASLAEAMALPQHEARGFFEEIDHPATGRQRQCGAPFKMSGTPWRTDRAPLLGEHTDLVLGGILGLDAGQIDGMRREGVV